MSNLDEWEDDYSDDELTPQQRAELEESSRAAHANPLEGSDWPTVRARILASIASPNGSLD